MSALVNDYDQYRDVVGESEDDTSSDESGSDEDSEEDSGEGSVSEDDEGITQNDDEVDSASESDGTGEKESCPICLARFRNQNFGTPESCDHTFCLECILEWSKNVNTCPIDRTAFDFVNVKSTPTGDVTRKVKVEAASKEPEGALQPDATTCEVCHGGDREDRLLLCDACDLAYHCECLDPPLFYIPVDEWFCPPCSRVLRTGAMAGCSTPRARRAIPRTRASETVRNRVQNLRTISRASTSRSQSLRTSSVQEAYLKSAQDRIAKRLSLCKSSKGGNIPDVKPKASSSSASFESKTSVSLFGSRNQLSDFSDDEEKPQPSKPSGSTSKSANSSKKLPLAAQASTSSLNLLDTIMANQTLLYTKPENVLIKTDGSVAVKNPNNDRKAPVKKPVEATSIPKFTSTAENGAIPKQRPASTSSLIPPSNTSVEQKLSDNSSQKNNTRKNSRRVTFSDNISSSASIDFIDSSSTTSNNKSIKLSDTKKALWKNTFDNRGIDKPFQNPTSPVCSQSNSENSSIANKSITNKKNKEKHEHQDVLSPDYIRNKRLQFYNRKLSTESNDTLNKDIATKSPSNPELRKVSGDNSNSFQTNLRDTEVPCLIQNTNISHPNINGSEVDISRSDHNYSTNLDRLNSNSNSGESQSLLTDKLLENQSNVMFENIKIKQEPISDEESCQMPPTQIAANVIDVETSDLAPLENIPGKFKVKEEPKDDYENEIKNRKSSLSSRNQSGKSASKQSDNFEHPVVFIKEEPISDEEECTDNRNKEISSNELFSKFLNNIPSNHSIPRARSFSSSSSVEELPTTQINGNLSIERNTSGEQITFPLKNSESENMNSYFKVLDDLPPEQLKNMLLEFLGKQNPDESNKTLHETVKQMSSVTSDEQVKALSEANTSKNLHTSKEIVKNSSTPQTSENYKNPGNIKLLKTTTQDSTQLQPVINSNIKNIHDNMSVSEPQSSNSELKTSVENSSNQGISISQFLSLARDANYIKQFSLNDILSLCNSLKTNVQIHHSVYSSTHIKEVSQPDEIGQLSVLSTTDSSNNKSPENKVSKNNNIRFPSINSNASSTISNEKSITATEPTRNNSLVDSSKFSCVNYKNFDATKSSGTPDHSNTDLLDLPATQINFSNNQLGNEKNTTNKNNYSNQGPSKYNSIIPTNTEDDDEDTPDLPLTQYKPHNNAEDWSDSESFSVTEQQSNNKPTSQICEDLCNPSENKSSSTPATQLLNQSKATKKRHDNDLFLKASHVATNQSFKKASNKSDEELDIPETQPSNYKKQSSNKTSEISSNSSENSKSNNSCVTFTCGTSNLVSEKCSSSDKKHRNSKKINNSSDSDDLFDSDMLDIPATQPAITEKEFHDKHSKISSPINTKSYERKSEENLSDASFKKPISSGIQWVTIKHKSKPIKKIKENEFEGAFDLPATEPSNFKNKSKSLQNMPASVSNTLKNKELTKLSNKSRQHDSYCTKTTSSSTESRSTSGESDIINEDGDIPATQPSNFQRHFNDKFNKNKHYPPNNTKSNDKRINLDDKSRPSKKTNSNAAKYSAVQIDSENISKSSNDSDDDTLDIPSTEPSFYTKINQSKNLANAEEDSQDGLDLPETQPFFVSNAGISNSKCLETSSNSFSNDDISQSVLDDEYDIPQTQPFEFKEVNNDSNDIFKHSKLTSQNTASIDEDDFYIPSNQLMEVSDKSNSEVQKLSDFDKQNEDISDGSQRPVTEKQNNGSKITAPHTPQNTHSEHIKNVDYSLSTSENMYELPCTQPLKNRYNYKNSNNSNNKTDQMKKNTIITHSDITTFTELPPTQSITTNVQSKDNLTANSLSNISINSCNQSFKIPKVNARVKQFSRVNNSEIDSAIQSQILDLPETQLARSDESIRNTFSDLPETQVSKITNNKLLDFPDTEPLSINLSNINNETIKDTSVRVDKAIKSLPQSQLNENLDLPETQVALDKETPALNQTSGHISEPEEDIQALILQAKASAAKKPQPSPQKVCVHRNLPQVIMPTRARHIPASRPLNLPKLSLELTSKERGGNKNHEGNSSDNSSDSTFNTSIDDRNVLFKMFKKSSDQDTLTENQSNSFMTSKVSSDSLQTKASENNDKSFTNNNNNDNKEKFLNRTYSNNIKLKNSEKFIEQNKEKVSSNDSNEIGLKEKSSPSKTKMSTDSVSDGQKSKVDKQKLLYHTHKNHNKQSKDKEYESNENFINQNQTSNLKRHNDQHSKRFDSNSDEKGFDYSNEGNKKTNSKENKKKQGLNSTEHHKEKYSKNFDYNSDSNNFDEDIKEKKMKAGLKKNEKEYSLKSNEKSEKLFDSHVYNSDNNENNKNTLVKEKTNSKRNKNEQTSNSSESFKERYQEENNKKKMKSNLNTNKKERSSNSTEIYKEIYSKTHDTSDKNKTGMKKDKTDSKRNKNEPSLDSSERHRGKYSEKFDYAEKKTGSKLCKKERSSNSTEVDKNKMSYEKKNKGKEDNYDNCEKKRKSDSTYESINSNKKSKGGKGKMELNDKSNKTSEYKDTNKRNHEKLFDIEERDSKSSKNNDIRKTQNLKEKKLTEKETVYESKTKTNKNNSNNFENNKDKRSSSVDDYKRKDKNKCVKDKSDYSKNKEREEKHSKSKQCCKSPENTRKSKKHIVEEKEKIHSENSHKKQKTSEEYVNRKSSKTDKVSDNLHKIKLEVTEPDKHYGKFPVQVKQEIEDVSESSLWSYGNSSVEELIAPHEIKQEPLDYEEISLQSDDQLCYSNSPINYKGELINRPPNKRKHDVFSESDTLKSKTLVETDLLMQKFPKKSKSCGLKKAKPKTNVLDALNKAADDIIKNSTYKLTPESLSINGRFQLEVRSESPISTESKDRKISSKQDLKEEIAEEVKKVLKPFYSVGIINKDDYKGIMRKAVPKIFVNCNHIINPEKIRKLVLGYVTHLKNS